MNDFLLDLGLSTLFTFLRSVVKNPTAKATQKKAMLKLRNAINLAYADDPDFK